MRSLAVKYRPKTFEEVVGHDTIIRILKNQLEQNRVGHAILFAGKTGSGKTSTARLLANYINKGIGTPIEIDAASNSSVDNVREIIKDAQERAIDGEYKVYIIDEVQSLSTTAWQAFLKCIEEPPKYTIFIFCTTDPQKVPTTIINRVQQFNFNNIPTSQIINRLSYVCENESFTNYQDGVNYLGKLANGCMREALTMLDKCADYSTEITVENIMKVLGTTSHAIMFGLVDSLIRNDIPTMFSILNDITNNGVGIKLFIDNFLEFLINIQKYIVFHDCNLTIFPSSREEDLQYIINFENPSNYFNYLINKIFELKNYIKNDSDIKSTMEVIFIQISRGQ